MNQEKKEFQGTGKMVALTFDDGPNETTTVEVLEKLDEYHIKASFFLIGDYINEKSAKIVKRAYQMGCEIANHSKMHLDMTKLSTEEIQEEIKYTSEKIYQITGEYPRFFRPPFILVNDTMFQGINLPFICGVGGRDWEEEVTDKERAGLILEQVRDGSIILLHDFTGNQPTVHALDLIIPKLQEDGYDFVTVSELFRTKGIEPTVHSGVVYTNVLQTNL